MQHSRRSVVAVVLLQMELNVYEIRVCILIFIRYLCLRVATRRAHECVCVCGAMCVEQKIQFYILGSDVCMNVWKYNVRHPSEMCKNREY